MDERLDLNRRDFGKLAGAALAGMAAATAGGCGPAATATGDAPAAPTAEAPADAPAPATENKLALHLCRGLNECKGQGQGGDNDCAGKGNCATVAEHLCGGQNDCKGWGGCGSNPAENDCKGMGHCAVPLMDSAWKKVRQKFEKQMADKGVSVGAAPPKKS